MREFDSGATRDNDEDKLDYEGFFSPAVMECFAQYMQVHREQADGKLRDSDNWQKGIPRDAYMKSMFRHFFSVWQSHRGAPGEKIEQLCALLFNVMGYLHEEIKDTPEYRAVPCDPEAHTCPFNINVQCLRDLCAGCNIKEANA